jgi:hypothetical protein
MKRYTYVFSRFFSIELAIIVGLTFCYEGDLHIFVFGEQGKICLILRMQTKLR